MEMHKYWGIEDPDVSIEELILLKKHLMKRAKGFYERLELDSYTETLEELEKVNAEIKFRKRYQELLTKMDWLIQQAEDVVSEDQRKVMEYLEEIARELKLNMDDLAQPTPEGKTLLRKDVIQEQKALIINQRQVKERRMMVKAMFDNFFNPLH